MHANCDSCPNGVSVEKTISRFAESLQSQRENIVLIRKLTTAEIRKIGFDELFLNQTVSGVLDAGYSIQLFQVLDKIKGTSNYLGYAAKIGMAIPNEWNRGVTNFLSPESSEWLMIVSPSPLLSEVIAGVTLIDIPDQAAGVISAASDNRVGVDVRALLSDLKVLSEPKQSSGTALGLLKTGLGRAICKQLPNAAQ